MESCLKKSIPNWAIESIHQIRSRDQSNFDYSRNKQKMEFRVSRTDKSNIKKLIAPEVKNNQKDRQVYIDD